MGTRLNEKLMELGYPPGPTREVAKSLNLRDMRTYEKLHEKYGDTFMLPLGQIPLVVTCSPEHISYLLGGSGQVDFPRPPNVIANVKRMFGRAQIALDGEEHENNKRMLSQYTFSKKHNKNMVEPLSRVVTEFCNKLVQSKTDSIEIFHWAELAAADMSGVVSHGKGYQAIQKGTCKELDALKQADHIFLSRAMNKNWKRDEKTTTTKAFDNSTGLLMKTFADRLDKAKKKEIKVPNILSYMVEQNELHQRKTCPFGDVPTEFEMKSNLVGFLAGVGNTARLISICVEKLAREQEVQQKILEELHHVYGDKAKAKENASMNVGIDIDVNQLHDFDLLENLEYTKCFINECLRMYSPSVSVAPRACAKDSQLGQFRIPAETKIMCNIHSSHRHSKYWDRPTIFDPMRWNTAETGKVGDITCKQFALGFYPFGFGGHGCIGKNLAQIFTKMIVATLVCNAQIVPKAGKEPASFNTLNSAQILGFTEAIGGVHVFFQQRPKVKARVRKQEKKTENKMVKEKSGTGNTVYSWDEIKKHNSKDSCWFVINDEVYDLTSWLTEHPGGSAIMIRQGGKDASKMFKAIRHSDYAVKESKRFIIGKLLKPKL